MITKNACDEKCPKCSGAVVMDCRCMLGHKYCGNGHMWRCDANRAYMLDARAGAAHGQEPVLEVINFGSETAENNVPLINSAILKKFGSLGFRPPYNSSGFYVSDSRGNTVAECRDSRVAKTLAELFNQLAAK